MTPFAHTGNGLAYNTRGSVSSPITLFFYFPAAVKRPLPLGALTSIYLCNGIFTN